MKLTLHLSNPLYTGSVSGTYAFDNGPPRSFSAETVEHGVVELGVVPVPNPRVWSIGDAQLHTITIDVDGATVTERFGLRQFGVDKATSRITVNGEIVKLVGWNHHTQWPKSAASPTDKEMDDDMTDKLQDELELADQFKDDLVPLALEYYLGVIDIDDQEGDDDSDGGGDSDDDEKPAKKKKGKKGGAPEMPLGPDGKP